MGTLVAGDIHLGNYYSDVLKFLQMLNKIKRHKDRVDEIVLAGDVIDGIEKYHTQSYKQYPESLSLQRNYVRWLVELLHNEFDKSEIILVLGNHEKDFRGILLDDQLLQIHYPFLKIKERHIDRNKMIYIHQLNDRSSSFTGWSPMAVTLALSEISRAEEIYKERMAGLATAHLHRGLSHLLVSGYYLIILPSFLKTYKITSKEIMFSPGILLIERHEDRITIDIFEDMFNDTSTVNRFNDILTSIIRGDYRKVSSIEKALKLTYLI